ncbi:acyltransferase [Streptomyces sp. DH12]|uniref:acyltransferase family protein n=1 Tax=Streptomyces sp. DH12 TaxID=2857010 RepID=UPI001E29AABC|nr:acyltransferase [Streptomyces sp. DH12]
MRRTGKGIRASDLAAATPATRDRYIDLLRVASLAVVVLGHWLMAAVTADGRVGNLLAIVPALRIATWALQVMPVFFFVGGFAHALSSRSHPAYDVFVRARLRRLLRPTVLFTAVWGAAALVVQLLGGGSGLTGTALRLVAQPLWFVGVYLAMVAFTPPLLRLHRRWGWGAFAALAAGAAAVDGLRFAGGVPFVGFLNFGLVWLAVHQLGFLSADGRLRGRRVPGALAGAGLAGAAALVALGPYPLSMVGMPGEAVSNMAPPSLALLCHGVWLVGAVELLRGPGTRLAARARVWRAVVAANGVAMTAFLWHLTAMLGVYGALLALDVPLPEPATGAWWAQLPPRLVAAAALTALLVALFRRAERPGRAAEPGRTKWGAPPAPGRGARGRAARGRGRASGPVAAAGVALCLMGVLGLSAVGFAGLLEGRTAVLVAVDVTAPATVAMILAGWTLVERSGRRPAPGRAGAPRQDGASQACRSADAVANDFSAVRSDTWSSASPSSGSIS